jgi:hypothetical protein
MSKATKAKPAVKEETALVTIQMDVIEKALETAREFPKRALEIKKEVDTIVSNAIKLVEDNKGEPLTKDNIEVFKLADRELRTKRTTLDGQRKSDNAPHSNTVAVYNSVYKTFETSIVGAEDKLEPLLKAYTKAEDERKTQEKLEKEKKRMERINIIIGLGGVFDDGKQVYVIHNPDPTGVNIELNAVDLISLSDETFDSLKLRANEFKEAKDKAKADKEAEEKRLEEKRLEDKRKLEADQEQMLNDRMEVRAQKFELMGFVEESGYFVNGRIKHKIDEIKVMSNDDFKELESSLKTAIAEAKKQEEIDQRVSSIIQLGFVASGNEFVFVRDDFNFKISKDSTLDATAIESAIAEFKEAKSDYDKKQAVLLGRKTGLLNIGFKYHSGTIYFKEIGTLSKRIDIASDNYVSELESIEKAVEEYAIEQQNIADKKKKCSDLLNQAGMRYDYAKEIFSYNFKTPDDKGVTESISISMDEVLGKSEQDLSKYVENFIAQVDMDNSAKLEYDNKLAKQKEIEEANKKTDGQNIEAFVSKVKELFETVIIKDENTRGKLQMQVDLFINEVEKM